jgi:hypothetical protein
MKFHYFFLQKSVDFSLTVCCITKLWQAMSRWSTIIQWRCNAAFVLGTSFNLLLLFKGGAETVAHLITLFACVCICVCM